MVIVGCKEGKEVQGEELKVVYEGAGDTAVLKSRLYDEPTISRQSPDFPLYPTVAHWIGLISPSGGTGCTTS